MFKSMSGENAARVNGVVSASDSDRPSAAARDWNTGSSPVRVTVDHVARSTLRAGT